MSTPPEMTGADPLNFGREGPPRSHTHLSVGDIIREQRIGVLERIFLWLAKTDYYVLHVVPNNCRVYLVSLGMMVLFTTLLAFCSSLYTLKTTLLPPDQLGYSQAQPSSVAAVKSSAPPVADVSPSGNLPDTATRNSEGLASEMKWALAILLASVYAFGILIIDREIVGAVSKKALMFRIVFAIVIATAVSWPVKLKFFEGRVDVEVNRMVDEKNHHRYQKIEAFKGRIENINQQIEQLRQTGSPERQQQRAGIQERIDSYHKEINVLDVEIDKESKKVRCGPICQGYREQKAKLVAELRQAEEQLGALATPPPLADDTKTEILRKQNDIKQQESQIDQLNKEIAHEHEVSYDFLTKWEALDRLSRDTADYKIMSTFIFLFFMLLEMVPLALKWSLGHTEYHYYLEARTNLNNQKIISLSNLYMTAMQRDDQGVLHAPAEITDMMAWLIEDESREHVTPMETRSLSELIREHQARRASANVSAPSESTPAPQRPATGAQAPAGVSPSSPTQSAMAGPAYAQTMDEDEPQR